MASLYFVRAKDSRVNMTNPVMKPYFNMSR